MASQALTPLLPSDRTSELRAMSLQSNRTLVEVIISLSPRQTFTPQYLWTTSHPWITIHSTLTSHIRVDSVSVLLPVYMSQEIIYIPFKHTSELIGRSSLNPDMGTGLFFWNSVNPPLTLYTYFGNYSCDLQSATKSERTSEQAALNESGFYY